MSLDPKVLYVGIFQGFGKPQIYVSSVPYYYEGDWENNHFFVPFTLNLAEANKNIVRNVLMAGGAIVVME